MSTQSDPAAGFQSITPSNTVKLTYNTRGVYVGGAGVIRCVSLDGHTTDFTAPAGSLIPIQTNQVMATGTTATLLVGLY